MPFSQEYVYLSEIDMSTKSKDILSAKELNKTINKIAKDITKDHSKIGDIVLLGIYTRGVPLSQRLKKELEILSKKTIPLGSLDITLYRDDLATVGPAPIVKGTDIKFDLTGKSVILVDDVLFTGRTVRAALDELADFGRPNRIQLAVLVDRGHRELPIHADYVGEKVKTERSQIISVKLKEIDGEDKVILK